MAVFGSIWDDIRHAFRAGNMVTKLVIVNFGIFALVNIFYFILWLANQGHDVSEPFWRFLQWFCVSSDWSTLIWQPWTLVTHMFLHQGFWHVLNNIIGLYLFGTIVGDLIGDRRVLPIYLLGGLVGGVLFFISAQFLPYVGAYALGASGAVMALAGAALILAPDYRVMLILLGEVKVKYIVLVIVLLDLVGIANAVNSGGHVAHIGGFAMGCLFVYRLRDGQDLAAPINNLLDRISGWFRPGAPRKKTAVPKRKPQMAYKGQSGGRTGNITDNHELSFQEKLDAILDKIKQKGYENLTPEEKEFLYQASKK
ncbi:MAG: rhomboid family intramembrane serine protease [Saprospiraceae bacterium]|nr:rhomboid family intramembrane serine protease [Saprospiraceae bacterium]